MLVYPILFFSSYRSVTDPHCRSPGEAPASDDEPPLRGPAGLLLGGVQGRLPAPPLRVSVFQRPQARRVHPHQERGEWITIKMHTASKHNS